MEQGPRNAIVLSARRDGIGARLTALTNAKRISESYELDFGFIWPESILASDGAIATRSISDLFSDEFIDAHLKPYNFGVASGRHLIVEEKDKAGFLEKVKNRSVFLDNNCFGISRFPWERWWEVKRAYEATFRSLGWSKTMTEIFLEIEAELKDLKGLAVHLRRGDLIDSDQRSGQYDYGSKFVPTMLAVSLSEDLVESDPNLTPVLFSESDFAKAQFQGHIKSARKIEDLVPFDGLTLLQRDVAELFAMSFLDTMLVGSKSAFSQIAQKIGRVKAVDLDIDVSKASLEKAHERLLTDVRRGHKAFENQMEFARSIPFVVQYLLDGEKTEQAFDILNKSVQASGAPLFLLNLLLRLRLENGQSKEVLDLFAANVDVAEQPSFNRPVAQSLVATAAIEEDRLALARKMQGIAFWGSSSFSTARCLAGLSATLGLGDGEDDFFVSENLIADQKVETEIDHALCLAVQRLTKGYSGFPVPAHFSDLLLWQDLTREKSKHLFRGEIRVKLLQSQIQTSRISETNKALLLAALELIFKDPYSALSLILDRERDDEPNAVELSFTGLVLSQIQNHPAALDYFERSLEAKYAGVKCRMRYAIGLANVHEFELADKNFQELTEVEHEIIEFLFISAEYWIHRLKADFAAYEIKRLIERIGPIPRVLRLQHLLNQTIGDHKAIMETQSDHEDAEMFKTSYPLFFKFDQ